jgi:ABC-type Mn2+/Zn2+ transport system ATPase subunit
LLAPALRIEGLSVTYPGSVRPAVGDLTLRLRSGSLAALVGPNGAGKSTLLKTIAGLLRPSHGTVAIHGLPPDRCHHRMAYLPQRSDVDWRFPVSVERFVMAGRYVHLGWLKWPRPNDRTIVDRAIERFRLTPYRHAQIGELSGGQQQRMMIARTIAQGADVILLDEPLNNLDTETKDDLLELFSELRNAQKTLVIATHDFDHSEQFFESVIRLRNGSMDLIGAAT